MRAREGAAAAGRGAAQSAGRPTDAFAIDAAQRAAGAAAGGTPHRASGGAAASSGRASKAALGPALATAAGASAQGLGRGVGTALAIRRVLRRPGEVVIAVPAALLVTSFGRHCRSPCRR